MLQAYDFIDQINVSTMRMKRALDRRQLPGNSRRSTVRSTEQRSDRDTSSGTSTQSLTTEAAAVPIEEAGGATSSEQDEAAELNSQPVLDRASWEEGETAEAKFRSVPLLWTVAAGKPSLDDEENIREYLALPAQHLRGDEIFTMEVTGDSMTGEDRVLEGDYVIVDPDMRWQNGDMVVAFIVDEGGATVKRI